MRTTIALDGDLIRKTQELTGLTDEKALVQEALTEPVEREGSRRLGARDAMPQLADVPRRAP